MSWQLVNWAMDQTTGSPPRKLILMLLAERCGEGKTECFPSQSDIALKAEISERQVQSHVKALVGLGLLRVRREKDQYGKFRHNVYELGITDDEVDYYHRPDKPFLDDRKARVKERSAKIQERPSTGSPLPMDEPPHPSRVTVTRPSGSGSEGASTDALRDSNGSTASGPTEVQRRIQRKSDASTDGSALPCNPSTNPSVEPKSVNPSRGGGTASPSPDPSRAPIADAMGPPAKAIEPPQSRPERELLRPSEATARAIYNELRQLTPHELEAISEAFVAADPEGYRSCRGAALDGFESDGTPPMRTAVLMKTLWVAVCCYLEEDEYPPYLIPAKLRTGRRVS